MDIVTKKQKFSPRIAVDGDKVRMIRTSVNETVAPADSTRGVVINWEFDFAKVTRAELLRMAAEHLVIKKRTEFKKLESETDVESATEQTFSVRDILDNETRKPADPMAKARKALADLTPEQLAEITGLPVENFQK